MKRPEKITVKGYEVLVSFDSLDQIYVASAPSLPGCMAHGESFDEAGDEMAIAIEAHLEAAQKLGQSVNPPMRSFG